MKPKRWECQHYRCHKWNGDGKKVCTRCGTPRTETR